MKTFQTFLQESRELLTEAAFDNKVNMLLNKNPDKKELINDTVKKTKQILGTNVDRMIWFLNYFEQNLNSKINNVLTDLEHYGLNIPENKNKSVSKIIFGKKSKEELFKELKKAEKLDKSKVDSSKGIAIEGNDQIILSFEDGTNWWYVDRSFCEKEGASGDHCGNVTGKEKPEQRILSLRNNKNQVILTFILEPDNSLGEMKAKGNNKPLEKYHPHILKLLSHPKFVIKNKEGKVIKTFSITGISGKGYAPYNNFSIFDLNEKDLNFIHNHNPKFIEDQIKINPSEIINSSTNIKNLYGQTVKKHKPEIVNLLKDPNNIKFWIEAIKKDKDLIVNLPETLWSEFPNFKETLIDTLSESTDLLLRSPKYISNNFDILKELLETSPNKLSLISPNYKRYLDLIDIIIEVSDGILDLSSMGLSKLPNLSEKIVKTFSCEFNDLTSLEGSPKKVTGDFICTDNKLVSLNGSPEEIGGSFFCGLNKLTSLNGVPKKIGRNFICSDNNLTSLEGMPLRIFGDFFCTDNTELKSMKGIENSKISGKIYYDKENMDNPKESSQFVSRASW